MNVNAQKFNICLSSFIFAYKQVQKTKTTIKRQGPEHDELFESVGDDSVETVRVEGLLRCN